MRSRFVQIKFLDVGCGADNFVRTAAELGMQAHGIEIHETNAKCAKNRKINVLHGEFRERQFEAAFFDFIQLKQVLEYVDAPVSSWQKLSGSSHFKIWSVSMFPIH